MNRANKWKWRKKINMGKKIPKKVRQTGKEAYKKLIREKINAGIRMN